MSTIILGLHSYFLSGVWTREAVSGNVHHVDVVVIPKDTGIDTKYCTMNVESMVDIPKNTCIDPKYSPMSTKTMVVILRNACIGPDYSGTGFNYFVSIE